MCYNTKYVGYEQKRRKQEHILFMGGGNTASVALQKNKKQIENRTEK